MTLNGSHLNIYEHEKHSIYVFENYIKTILQTIIKQFHRLIWRMY